MSRFDDRSPGDGSYPRCIESLRTTHDEARTVLDHQIATLNDIEWMLERRFREDEWLAILLESYADWIDWTDWLNGFNAVYLALTQASLGIGLVLLTVGVFDGLGTSVQLLSVSVYSLPVQLVATLCCVGILASAVRKMRGARA